MPRRHAPRSTSYTCKSCLGTGRVRSPFGQVLCVPCAGTGAIRRDLNAPLPPYKGWTPMVTGPVVFAGQHATAPGETFDGVMVTVLVVVGIMALLVVNEFLAPGDGSKQPGIRSWWRARCALRREQRAPKDESEAHP